MVKFRRHRLYLIDSLETTVEVNSIEEIEKITGYTNVTVEKYGNGIDERCGWDTHIVCENGRACGFTDGML